MWIHRALAKTVFLSFMISVLSCTGSVASRSNLPNQHVDHSIMTGASIEASYSTNYVILPDGQMLSWGTTWATTNIHFPDGPEYSRISIGSSHVVALSEDGVATVDGFVEQSSWASGGANRYPFPAIDLTNIKDIASGDNFTIALTETGEVTLFGAGADDPHDPHAIPQFVVNAVKIDAGYNHCLALLADGRVVVWGAYALGQANIPKKMTDEYAMVDIAAGENHSIAVNSAGEVFSWGDNDYNQLEVPQGLTDIVAVFAGGDSSAALNSNGDLVVWGKLGNTEKSPNQLKDIAEVAIAADHILAKKTDGTYTIWGVTERVIPTEISDQITITTN